MQTGLLVPSRFPPRELAQHAEAAESLGFDYFWYPDEKFYRDVYVGLTIVAIHTSRIQIGTCVTDPYSRHPLQTAVAIASLAEIAPGRTALGLGAGGRGFTAMGLERTKPAIALREAIQITRAALQGETVDLEGRVISVKEGRLDFEPATDIPIIIGGGYGPLVLQLAGEVADGVMIHSYATEAGLRRAMALVRRGMDRGRRSAGTCELISRVDFCVDDDRCAALRAVKPSILSALRASYPDLAYLKPYPDLHLPDRLRKVIVLTRQDDAAKHHYYNPEHLDDILPDEFVRHFAVAGNVDDVAEQIASIAEIGFDQITIKPVVPSGGTVSQVIECFMHEVIPAALR